MFEFLRSSSKTKILKDEEAFWAYLDATQRTECTPEGPQSDAAERLALILGTALKAILEAEIGPEEGPNSVHMQNWNWNDDQSRAVHILRRAFKPTVLSLLQALLKGEFEEFRIVLMLHEEMGTEMWGGIVVTRASIALQRKVAQAYAIAA